MSTMALVYDKTDKGREEIATRKYHIPARLRSLLVMIDGRLTLDALLKNVAGLGVTRDNIDELLHDDYITLIGGEDLAAPPAAAPARLPPGLRTRGAVAAAGARAAAASAAAAGSAESAALGLPGDMAAPEPAPYLAGAAAAEAEPAPTPVQLAATAQASAQAEAERFRHLYDFYNQTIKSTIGLRGIMLQLKVEKCATVDDFRELRLAYLEAVLKAKGSEMAHSMRGRLDHLLGGKPEHDPFLLPDD